MKFQISWDQTLQDQQVFFLSNKLICENMWQPICLSVRASSFHPKHIHKSSAFTARVRSSLGPLDTLFSLQTIELYMWQNIITPNI